MPVHSFSSKKPKDTKGTLKRVLTYFKKYRILLFIVFLLCLTSNVFALLGPSYAGSAIQEAAAGVGNVNFERVKYYAARMLFVYVVSSLLTISINVIMIRFSKQIGKQLRKDVFDKLMKLPVSYYHNHATGDIISRVSYDIDVVSTCIASDVTQILSSAVTIVGSFLMMIVLSPALSVIVLITIPLSIFYTAWMRKKVVRLYSYRSRSYGILNGFAEEMLSGHKTIQAYAYENRVCNDFDAVNLDAANAYANAEMYSSTIGPTMGFINNLSLSLIALLGTILFMYQKVTLHTISSFVLYSRKFSGPINEIANIINEIFSALSAAERVFNLLDEEEEKTDVEHAVVLEQVDGKVEFDDVSFGYEKNKTILHHVSLIANPGETIAIVGHTGAGKTTLINLLMRFYEIDEGQIRIDGINTAEATRSSVRGAFAMVLQDTWMFSGTIFDNIAYGKPDATMEEVVNAAKAAHIHPFIMRLPNGYQTKISEDGGNISKGQKQLLTIARAMLYDAKMLILDEATSNVDTSTEKQVQEAMKKLMVGKTCFVIAHRLSTIQNADHILVVDNGDIVEQGNHAELIAKKGYYYNLYRSQFD